MKYLTDGKEFATMVAAFAIVALSLALPSALVFAGEAASVDGFVGVPFGSSRQQVATSMDQRGFKQVDEATISERTSWVVYRGTFMDLPADLTFKFGEGGFYIGEADFVYMRDQEILVAMSFYPAFKKKFVLKYGKPDIDDGPAGGGGAISRWDNLRSAGKTPVPARIMLWAGAGRRLRTYGLPTTKDLFRIGLLVVYQADIVKDSY